MSERATKTSRASASSVGAFPQLRALMNEIGLNLSVWDIAGKPVDPLEPTCDFCRTVRDAGGRCRTFSRALAERIVTDGEAAGDRAATGCCVQGVPIYQRRRLRGAAVTCFPVREMLDQDLLAHLCDRLQLDRRSLEGLACDWVRHTEGEAGDFLRMLDWSLQREQGRVVAEDELGTLSANLTSTYEELSLLYRVSGSMRVTQQVDEFLQSICDELCEVMNIETATAVVYTHPPAIDEDIVVIAGASSLDVGQIKALAALDISPKFISDNCGVLNNNFAASSSGPRFPDVRSVIAAPLTMDDERLGMLVGLNKCSGDFDSIDLKLINAVGSQVAAFLSNNHLYADLQDLLMGVLHALTATIDAKDPYTCGHSQRVALISRRLAEECGFAPEKVRSIYLAGILHDIGKIGIPEAILCKHGRLTPGEYEDIKRHPALGAKILGGIRQLDEVITGILGHHERPDGKGYPSGLSGEEVLIEGLIIGLADGFDAMTSDRTYRKALPLAETIEEIRRNAGTQFDAGLVEKFLSFDLEEFMGDINRPTRTVFPIKLTQGQN